MKIHQLAPAETRNSFTYERYKKLMETLKEEGGTTGPKQTEELAYYTALNHQRMKRLDKSVVLNDALQAKVLSISRSLTWVVLTEAWCGDAAQALPVIQKLAGLNSNIDLQLYLRDENPDLMDRHLTNNSRSIPKLIISNENGEELGKWGPRPAELQEIYDNWRHDPNKTPYQEFLAVIQKWYHKDRTQAVQQELELLLDQVLAKGVISKAS